MNFGTFPFSFVVEFEPDLVAGLVDWADVGHLSGSLGLSQLFSYDIQSLLQLGDLLVCSIFW